MALLNHAALVFNVPSTYEFVPQELQAHTFAQRILGDTTFLLPALNDIMQ